VGAADITSTMIEQCLSALDDRASIDTFRGIVADAVAVPEEMAALVSLPLAPDANLVLYQSDRLVVTQSVFPARFRTGVHNHAMPALIGVWSGYEDNHLYRCSDGEVVTDGATRVHAGEVLTLGTDVIHDVHSPEDRFPGAIHVYLGDFFHAERYAWADPSTPPEPFDFGVFRDQWTQAMTAAGLSR
jgi:predicted metal-dependent enzyme (double-stranded beta helix superfamily)